MKISLKSSLNEKQLNQIGITCFTALKEKDFDKTSDGKYHIKSEVFLIWKKCRKKIEYLL